MKKCAIIQPSFIPWKGFFDIIQSVDIFVHYDDVQYTSSDWRNKNFIYGKNGLVRLTIPIKKTSRETLIKDVLIDNNQDWKKDHLKSIQRVYSKAAFYQEYLWIIEEIYSFETVFLSDFVINATELISRSLGIKTTFVKSSDLGLFGAKDDKLIRICRKLGAKSYLSGPSAKDYIELSKWNESDIEISFKNYRYLEYNQLSNQFNHYVSIIDVMFNNGLNTINLIKEQYQDD